MSQGEHDAVIPVRSVFISDCHLGFRFARADDCLAFLKKYQPESLYLVGDFLDGWRLQRAWYWPPIYDEIVDHLINLSQLGTKIFYTPGNHDEFLRGPIPSFAGIEIADHFVHETADGRRLCVTHGDLFDSIEKKMHRLSQFGGRVYDGLMWTNYLANRGLNAIGIGEWNYCFWIKRFSKQVIGAVNDYQSRLTQFAHSLGCDAVICGHIHAPRIDQSNQKGIAYCNTGDWVEHRSGMIELQDGTLQLIDSGEILNQLDPKVAEFA